MQVNINKLEGAALDWAVAKCEDLDVVIDYSASWRGTSKETNITWHCYAKGTTWEPSVDWEQGGPIIEREDITITKFLDYYILPPNLQTTQTIQWGTRRAKNWIAYCSAVSLLQGEIVSRFEAIGITPLIAAMRCYVASKLGDEIEIPGELYHAK